MRAFRLITHGFSDAVLLYALLMACAVCVYPAETNRAASKYELPRSLSAKIYSMDRKTLLFTFSREARQIGDELEALRDYKYPDGKIAAREQVVYRGDDLVSYTMEQNQTGAKGTAKIGPAADSAGKKVIAFAYSTDGAVKHDTEALRPDTLINDMVGRFLFEHWETLMKGEPVRCRFIVISRRETVGFTFTKHSETTRAGAKVVAVKMSATSTIIARLVEPLYFTIERDGQHRVLEYIGRTTPKIKHGNKWEDLDAVTVFDWK